MRLLQLVCPGCGAKLTVSDQLKSITCNYCGVTTLIDDEIIKVEHTIKDTEKEKLIKGIDAFLKMGRVDDAQNNVDKLIDSYSYESETWLYAIKAYTNNYDINYPFEMDAIEEFLNNYSVLEENDSLKKDNVKKINDFLYDYSDRDEIECPYCYETIYYGDKKCKFCGRKLYWN